MRSHWNRAGPNPMIAVFTRRGNLGPTLRRPCEGRDGDWSNASTRQGTPKIGGKYEDLGERHAVVSPSELSEGTNPANTWISDFRPPELWKNKYLLFWSSPKELRHHVNVMALWKPGVAPVLSPRSAQEVRLVWGHSLSFLKSLSSQAKHVLSQALSWWWLRTEGGWVSKQTCEMLKSARVAELPPRQPPHVFRPQDPLGRANGKASRFSFYFTLIGLH